MTDTCRHCQKPIRLWRDVRAAWVHADGLALCEWPRATLAEPTPKETTDE